MSRRGQKVWVLVWVMLDGKVRSHIDTDKFMQMNLSVCRAESL